MSAFFMLYREGGGAPTVKHMDRDVADHEADRIARTHGGPVYVLQAVGKVEVKAEWTDLGPRRVDGHVDAKDLPAAKFPGEWVDFPHLAVETAKSRVNRDDLLFKSEWLSRGEVASVEIEGILDGCRIRALNEMGAAWLELQKVETDRDCDPHGPPTDEQVRRHAADYPFKAKGAAEEAEPWGLWCVGVPGYAPTVLPIAIRGGAPCISWNAMMYAGCNVSEVPKEAKWYRLAQNGRPLTSADDDIPW